MLNCDEIRNLNHPESTVETNWLPIAEAVYYQVSLNPFLKITITKKSKENICDLVRSSTSSKRRRRIFLFRIEVIKIEKKTSFPFLYPN